MENTEQMEYQSADPSDYASSGHASATYGTMNKQALQVEMNLSSVPVMADLCALTDEPGDANAHGQNPNIGQVSENVASYEAKTDSYRGEPTESLVINDNMTDTSQLTGYGTLNGSASETASYHSSGAVENGSISIEKGGNIADQTYEDVALSVEEERLWNMVRANSLDFNAWTALIDETEKNAENNIIKIRRVYDAFLPEFPLCYGYWKKYADHEGRLDSADKVVEVYERAVLAVTYSVEIWLHYCGFAISTYEDPDTIRRLFERGLAYVGTDYHSYQLWDEYIRYEESVQAWSHVAMIYTRILEHPIQQLDRYYNCFKELAASHPFSEIQIPEEASMSASSVETGGQGHEERVCPDVEEQPSKPVSPGLTEAEELEKYIAIREEMYKKAKEYESKIIGFETAIKRPYFHVRPLDDPELENWHNYLDFIERGDDFNKVVKLYERCLIACANYPEFWIRYVLFMEVSGSMELANNALARSTQVFVKKRPEIHLFAARFKELSGDISGARFEYQILYSESFPSLLEAIVKHANMEYRQGDKDAAFHVYERAIAVEREKENSKILPYLLIEYSRFVYLVVGDAEKAREILAASPEQWQLSRPQLEAIIHLESIQPLPKRVEYLDSLVEKFITPNPENPKLDSVIDREEVSSIFLEFLDLFGDAQSIKKAESRHSLMFLRQKGVLVSKKRYAEDSLVSDKVKMLNAASDQSQSVMGAYPSTQNQWAAGYDQKASTWTPASQVQAQWNHGYPPQAGYAAYGSYANYANPQMPGSAPQGAAYGAYPPAYPSQSYAQPTAAVAAPFPSQPAPAPAPPSYYGSYY